MFRWGWLLWLIGPTGDDRMWRKPSLKSTFVRWIWLNVSYLRFKRLELPLWALQWWVSSMNSFSVAILLMEEIPNNHLGCIKPCKLWDQLYLLTGDRRIPEPSTVVPESPFQVQTWEFHWKFTFFASGPKVYQVNWRVFWSTVLPVAWGMLSALATCIRCFTGFMDNWSWGCGIFLAGS